MFCYNAKKNQNKAEGWKKGNLNMINSYMVLNEQASHLSYSGKNEVKRSKFDIGRRLGGGNFGSVRKTFPNLYSIFAQYSGLNGVTIIMHD